MSKITDIRPSALAGRWYPANPEKLKESVDSYIYQAKLPEISGEIIALISPHAGHIYSGPVAGYCFAALQNLSFDLVVILSPFHQHHSDAILTTAHQAYQTPLGFVPVDQPSLEAIEGALKERTGIQVNRVKNDSEHAVEILLPFFQRSLVGEFNLLPLMIHQQEPELMRTLGEVLADTLKDKKALLVASTDLSHFHTAEKAEDLDQTIINNIKALDPDGLYLAQAKGSGSACGLGALAAVMWAANMTGPVTAHTLNYAHSGDITGDNSSVVGYTSAVLTRK
ncbi:MAG: AmmeMemoRadiSam system protein B [Anaerolineales bacterium]|nr:AmmeMemoRadiSam system protein B [Anaerolineales bacterium]